MLGDIQGLNRSLSYYKAFAAYNMVFLHGLSMTFIAHPSLELSPIALYATVTIRCLFSICQPAFAGFYVRNQVGPYLQRGRIPVKFLFGGFELLFWAFAIEAVRLSFWSLSIAPIFFWSALHFIALAALLTYGLLAVDRRLPAVVCLLLLLGKGHLDLLLRPKLLALAELTPTQLQYGATLWSAALGILVGVAIALLAVRLGSQRRSRYIGFGLGALVALLVVSITRPIALQNAPSVLSFLNLPVAIFTAGTTDYNYWPLLTFYPLFMLGYYMRDILYDRKKQKFFFLLTAAAVFYAVYFFITGFSQYNGIGPKLNVYAKEPYMMSSTLLLSLLGVFYLCFLGCYVLAVRLRWRILDIWARYSRNVVVLYVIHPLFFAAAARFLPLEGLASPVRASIWFPVYLYLFIHFIYFLSLICTERINLLLKKVTWILGVQLQK